jgi:hypothetical protein
MLSVPDARRSAPGRGLAGLRRPKYEWAALAWFRFHALAFGRPIPGRHVLEPHFQAPDKRMRGVREPTGRPRLIARPLPRLADI